MIPTRIRPDSNFDRLKLALTRAALPDRVPFVELFADLEIREAVLEKPAPRGEDLDSMFARLAHEIEFQHRMGYDYVRVVAGPDFPHPYRNAPDTAKELTRAKRDWVVSTDTAVPDRRAFERYPWPVVEDSQFASLEYASRNLPDGMKIIACQGGLLEHVTWMLGYENLCLKLLDDPDLVRDAFNRVGELQRLAFRRAVEYDNVGALWYSDDLGFRTQTLISPDDLREFVFPWHKKLVDLAHANGMPALLHACGNLEEVMDDIIDDCRYDAKHSFEDAILPIERAKDLYGRRITLLGGIDMDFLTRATPEAVRRRTKEVLRHCMPEGGYCLGTGNTVANYVPIENYVAILDAGWEFGRY